MKPYPFCSLNHFTVPVAIGCPFTAGCMNAAPQRGRRLSVDHLGGSLNVRPAVRSEAAQASGQRSMDEKYTPRRRFSMPVERADGRDLHSPLGKCLNPLDLRSEALITSEGKTLVINDWERLQQVAQFDPEYLHADQRIERD